MGLDQATFAPCRPWQAAAVGAGDGLKKGQEGIM
jgi:hypothetical protein